LTAKQYRATEKGYVEGRHLSFKEQSESGQVTSRKKRTIVSTWAPRLVLSYFFYFAFFGGL